MKTVGEIFHLSKDFFIKRGFDNPRYEVEEMLSFCLGMKRLEVYLFFDRPIAEGEILALRAYMKRRGSKEPHQYIQGSVSFMDCMIEVNKNVLIPRPETEELCALISKEGPFQTILDLCTGSGALAIQLKKTFPLAEVVAVDLSKEALAVAKKNSVANGQKITFVQSDMFSSLCQTFDLIVSNPPYISEDEFSKLDESVRCFEPELALLGGKDGLLFYRKIAASYSHYLNPKGKLFLEIGYDQKESVEALFQRETPSAKFQTLFDSQGKSRFFSLTNG